MRQTQQTLTRAKLRQIFHYKLEIDTLSAGSLLESILKEITGILAKGHELKIVSFGTFLIHHKKERIGRNPKTKVEAKISPRKSISFRPSMALRKRTSQDEK